MAALAKKIEPQGEWLSKSAIARRLKLHVQTVSSRLDDLGYEPDEDRSTPKNQVYWFDDEMEFAVKAAKDSLTAAKIRDLRVKTELNELKLAEARGEMVMMSDATERVQEIMTRMFKEFSQQQPKRLAARLVKARTTAEVTKILKLDTGKVFGKLRENDEAFVPVVK